MSRNRTNTLAAIGTIFASTTPILGCSSAAEESALSASPEPGHFRSQEGDGRVQIIWNIPEEQQPPLLDGARDVLTTAAISGFDARVGRFLRSSPTLYEGALTLGSDRAVDVMVTWHTQGSLWLEGVQFDEGVHELSVYSGTPKRWLAIWQDRLWGALSAEARPAGGIGSAWLDVEVSAGERLRGRCVACMTILEEEPVDAIAVTASSIDPEESGAVSIRVDADLERVVPEAFTPELLYRLWRAMGEADRAPDMLELVEIAPGVWERVHTDRTYLRCKEGGSRLVDYRTTWRVQPGDTSKSGIGDIEVFGAAECEAFDYGGGS
jgi:hypothetical protein